MAELKTMKKYISTEAKSRVSSKKKDVNDNVQGGKTLAGSISKS